MDSRARSSLPDLPSGTVTFLFTDIEGSTRLVKELGESYAEALGEHQRLLRAAFDEAGGQEIDTQGDAFFVAFRRAKDAVRAAVGAQRALADHPWPAGVPVLVRMGIHTGEPSVGSERYVGLGVHRAARICAAGHGGQILLSKSTRELLREDPPPDTRFRDLGEQRLKDLDEPERIYQVLATGLAGEFPPLNAVPAGVEPSPAGWPEFRILGPLEVSTASGPVRLGGQKQRALLAILLLNAGKAVATDRLIDGLWGERPPRTAATSLQNFVAQLRKLLGPDRVVTKPPGYLLRAEPNEIDLGRFERLVREARRADPDERARKLQEALALWRGDALADFTFEPFAETEIRRLEELRLAVMEELVDAELELGRHAELVGALEPLVAQNPHRERLRGQLMLALYRSGRQAEALQAYHDSRRALVDELGIEPSRALQQLHASILRQEAGLEPSAPVAPIGDHYGEVLKAMLAGRLVPVLGTGVNVGAKGREADREPRPGPFLPDGTDIVAHLAEFFECPPARARDITRVSQYVALMQGIGPLYDELHGLFDRDYEPGPVHRFLARAAAELRERAAPQQLIVSTNYDQSLERAFAEAGVKFDVVSYVATGRHRGKFLHVAADGSAAVVDVPNAYSGISFERTVILNVHGQVDRSPEREWESFVVSEDDYIDYLAQTELASVVPVTIAARLRRSHFLFLGYPLQEWHLRVFLHRVWGHEKAGYRSWAVEEGPDSLEGEFWRQRGVELFDLQLDRYAQELEQRLADLPQQRVAG